MLVITSMMLIFTNDVLDPPKLPILLEKIAEKKKKIGKRPIYFRFFLLKASLMQLCKNFVII